MDTSEYVRKIPEVLPEVQYFLKELNTPFWFWTIRVVLLAGLAVAIAVCLYSIKHEKNRKDD